MGIKGDRFCSRLGERIIPDVGNTADIYKKKSSKALKCPFSRWRIDKPDCCGVAFKEKNHGSAWL